MDHAEIWEAAIAAAKSNPSLASAVPLLEFQRDVLYPQGEAAVRNWLNWVEQQAAN